MCFVFSTCKEYERFVPLAHKLKKHKAIPLFFHLALDAFPDIRLVGWIEKKETKNITRSLRIEGSGTPGQR